MGTRSLRAGLAALPAAWLLTGCGAAASPPRHPEPSPYVAPPPRAAQPPPGLSPLHRPGVSIVAQARHGHVLLYREPGARRPLRVQRSPDGRFPLVLLVAQARPGWLQVRLPVRPNQSTAWIRQAEVTVSYDAYRVEVSLHRHRLSLWRATTRLDDQRIGVGRAATPTPPGLYYTIQRFRLSDPGGPYGPYALGLSAYSNVLQTFGGGPGQIALHGTNDLGGIGSNVSHGCIHLSNGEISRLARLLPLGTPVRIFA